MSTTTTAKMSSTTPTSTTTPQLRTTTTEQTGIHYSTIYLHTVPGTLKIVCLICVLIGFILVQCSQHSYGGIPRFYCTIAMIAFWMTAILLALYLFHAIYVFHKIPWIKIEFFFCAGAAACLLLASALIGAQNVGLFTAAAFFGFVAMCAYAYDAFLKYRQYNVVVTNVVTRTTTVTVA
ncbi:plasmolipin-like [Contarinia nasturtii]|uniref:plasmolipin-like n=1 Tax=Contarinia nasturtii TaxID=265458 RepID=UPI0012D43B01|nr:plasmolipin-like [Contarinia nasturtii]XP_031616950.1 plasmolipin-like [Contarinia nasturtii]XP_031616951.1 plasmolipin-like [Contarinia nasturtii]